MLVLGLTPIYSVLLASTGENTTHIQVALPSSVEPPWKHLHRHTRGVFEVIPTKSQSIWTTTEALQHLTGRVLITQASSALGCSCSSGRMHALGTMRRVWPCLGYPAL